MGLSILGANNRAGIFVGEGRAGQDNGGAVEILALHITMHFIKLNDVYLPVNLVPELTVSEVVSA
jgi:hypothetical protein